MGAVAGLRAIRTAGHRPGRHRPDPARHAHARLLDALDRGARQGGDREHAGGGDGRRGGLLGLRLRVRDGPGLHRERASPDTSLVIGAELLTRFLDYSDRNTCILFGDGAGAVVLSASDEPGGGLGIELTTEPQGAYMIWLPAGGAKSPPSAETIARGEHFIRMEGKETYRFATRTLASTALESIRRSGLEPSDIDLFIPHQANIRIIEAVAKGLDLPMEKMFVNLDRYGNTSAASVPIALAEAVNEGRVKVGDHVVHGRVRRRLHVGRGDDPMDGRPGARAARVTRPSGPRTSPSASRWTGTRSTRSRRRSPRSSSGRSRRASRSRSTTSCRASHSVSGGCTCGSPVSDAYQVELRTVGDGPTALGSAGPFTLVADRPASAGGGGLGFQRRPAALPRDRRVRLERPLPGGRSARHPARGRGDHGRRRLPGPGGAVDAGGRRCRRGGTGVARRARSAARGGGPDRRDPELDPGHDPGHDPGATDRRE